MRSVQIRREVEARMLAHSARMHHKNRVTKIRERERRKNRKVVVQNRRAIRGC